MALPATDTFSPGSAGTDLTAYSSSWTAAFSNTANQLELNGSGAARSIGSSQEVGNWWNADSFNANHYAEAVISNLGTNDRVGVMVRAASAGNNYGAYSGASQLEIWENVGGTWTQLGAAVSVSWSAGSHTLKLSADGTTLTLDYDASQTSRTDASHSTGAPGVSGYSDATPGGSLIESWTGDDVPLPPGPQIAATGGEVGTSLGSNNAQTLPTGSTSGDLVVVWVTVDNPSTTNITASTGWTQLFHHVAGSNVVKHAAFARVLDGGANDTLTITGAAQDYCVSSARITDHGVTDPATDIKVGTPAAATSGSANPPSLDAGASDDWLWLASAGVDFTTGNTISADPANYSNVDNRTSASSTSSCGQRVAKRSNTTQTEDPGTFTNTSQEWVAGTIAIPPESGTADATATPGKISAPVTLPAVAVSAGWTVGLAAIAAPATLPAVTAQVAAIPTPAAIAAPSILPAVVARTGWTVSPVAVPVPSTTPPVTPSAGSTTSPAPILAPSSLPAASARAGATGSPAPILAPATVPAVAARAGWTVALAAILAPSTLPAVAVTAGGGATASPGAIAVASTLPAAVARAGWTVGAAAVVVPATVLQVAASGGGSASPAPGVILAPSTLPAVSARSGWTTAPTPVATAATLPAAVARTGWTVTPAGIFVPVTLPQVTAGAGATASPSPVVVVSTVPAVAAASSSVASPAVIGAVVTLPAVAVRVDWTAGPSPILVVSTVKPVTVLLVGIIYAVTSTRVGVLWALGTTVGVVAPATVVSDNVATVVT